MNSLAYRGYLSFWRFNARAFYFIHTLSEQIDQLTQPYYFLIKHIQQNDSLGGYCWLIQN